MFYQQNQFDTILNCTSCMQRYDIPLLLPCCWKTVCKQCVHSHIEQINNKTKKDCYLKCPFCTKTEKVTIKNGDFNLPINEAISKLLVLKPVNLIHADLYRKLGDLFKTIQSDLNELDIIEKQTTTNLNDFFDMVKNEILKNIDDLIEKANKLKFRLLNDLDLLKQSFNVNINYLFKDKSNSKLLKFKNFCFIKLNEWQLYLNSKTSSQSNLDSILTDAQSLSLNLKQKNNFLLNSVLRHKIVFNQKHDLNNLLENFIGKLELNPDLDLFSDTSQTIRYLNDLICLEEIEIDQSTNIIYLLPVWYKKFLYISKRTYDEFSDIEMRLIDSNGTLIHSNNDLLMSKINYANSYSNYIILSITDYKTGRNLIKLYDTSLNLLKTAIIDNQSNLVYMNSSHLYVKVESTYPFLYKYDHDLNRVEMFEHIDNTKTSDLLVSLSTDRLIHVDSKRIYLMDNCFGKIKIYSEINGDLIEEINFKTLRDCSVYVKTTRDQVELNSDHNNDDDNDDDGCLKEEIICLNKYEKTIKLFNSQGDLIVENKLDSKIKNINDFYMTQDGSFVFVDHLNDYIYCYNV